RILWRSWRLGMVAWSWSGKFLALATSYWATIPLQGATRGRGPETAPQQRSTAPQRRPGRGPAPAWSSYTGFSRRKSMIRTVCLAAVLGLLVCAPPGRTADEAYTIKLKEKNVKGDVIDVKEEMKSIYKVKLADGNGKDMGDAPMEAETELKAYRETI